MTVGNIGATAACLGSLANFAFSTTLLPPHVDSLCSLTTYRKYTRNPLLYTRNFDVESLRTVATRIKYRPLKVTSLPTRNLVCTTLLKFRVDSA